jgi:hypothetical protein
MKVTEINKVHHINCEDSELVSEFHYEIVGKYACWWYRWRADGEGYFGEMSAKKFARLLNESVDFVAVAVRWGRD